MVFLTINHLFQLLKSTQTMWGFVWSAIISVRSSQRCNPGVRNSGSVLWIRIKFYLVWNTLSEKKSNILRKHFATSYKNHVSLWTLKILQLDSERERETGSFNSERRRHEKSVEYFAKYLARIWQRQRRNCLYLCWPPFANWYQKHHSLAIEWWLSIRLLQYPFLKSFYFI